MSVIVTNETDNIPFSLTKPEYEFSRDRGWITTLKGEGSEARCLAQGSSWAFAGFDPVRVRHIGGDLYVVEGTVSGLAGSTPVDPNTLITTVWSVKGNMLEKDLWEKPVVKTQLDAIEAHYSSDLIKATQAKIILKLSIQAALEGKTEIELPNLDGVAEVYSLSVQGILDFAALSGASDTSVFRKLMDSMARGTEKLPVSQWVLSRTKTGPLSSSLRGLRTNVNRMYTTAKLVADESVPTTLLDDIPPGYWLKMAPTVAQEGDRLRVDNEWWWAEDYDRFTLEAPITV